MVQLLKRAGKCWAPQLVVVELGHLIRGSEGAPCLLIHIERATSESGAFQIAGPSSCLDRPRGPRGAISGSLVVELAWICQGDSGQRRNGVG